MKRVMKSSVGISAIFVMGCSTHIEILSATSAPISDVDRVNIESMAPAEGGRSWRKVQLTVNSVDLRRAMHSESTVFINIIDCSERSLQFPSVAFLGNVALDERQKQAADILKDDNKVVTIYGYAPADFTNKFKSTCVELQGGSYMGSSVRSSLVRLVGGRP